MDNSVGYIRRSHADDEGEVSKDTQERAIAALAERDGLPVQVLSDWGVSGGDEALSRRPMFRELLRRVEAGTVGTVYAYKLDRLGRGQSALGKLWGAAEATGTRIVTAEEGNLSDTGDPAKWLLRHTLSGFAEFYLREQKRKAQATREYRKRRGDDVGLPRLGYVKAVEAGTERVYDLLVHPEYIATVTTAYEASGTFLGAARVLNSEHVPVPLARQVRQNGQPYGKGRYDTARWHASTVRRLIHREAQAMMPSTIRQGTRGAGRPRLFAGLLRCYCGATLTPGGGPRTRSWSYYCARGQRDPNHGKPYTVSEPRLLPWMQVEAAHLLAPGDSVELPGDVYDDRAERAALDALRGKVADSTIAAGLADLDARAAAAGGYARIVAAVPEGIDWERDTVASINVVLRAMWHAVHLGPDLLPVEADWTVPQWRRAG